MATENRVPSETDAARIDDDNRDTGTTEGRSSPHREESLEDKIVRLEEENRLALIAKAKANKDAERHRRRAEELETKDSQEREQQEAKLSDLERLKRDNAVLSSEAADAKREAAQAKADRLELRLDIAVERQAHNDGWAHPGAATRLIDRKRVEHDEDTDTFKGIKEALEKVKRDFPGIDRATVSGGTPPREGPSRRGGGRGGDPRADIEAELRASGNYV